MFVSNLTSVAYATKSYTRIVVTSQIGEIHSSSKFSVYESMIGSSLIVFGFLNN